MKKRSLFRELMAGIQNMRDASEGKVSLVSYEYWLADEVQAAIDDSRPSVPQERVEAGWKIERVALFKRAENEGE